MIKPNAWRPAAYIVVAWVLLLAWSTFHHWVASTEAQAAKLEAQSQAALDHSHHLSLRLAAERAKSDSIASVVMERERLASNSANEGSTYLARLRDRGAAGLPRNKDSMSQSVPASASDSASYWHGMYLLADSAALSYRAAYEQQQAATAALAADHDRAWQMVDSLSTVNSELATSLKDEVAYRHRRSIPGWVKIAAGVSIGYLAARR
jgi:hypothetical protein